jgi:hypothetical protein
MKIALIGNMNNNNFSMMRYFRDLGADAYLLPFAGDGARSLTHFTPEADTWEIEKWQPFIQQLDIDNGLISIIGLPHRLIFPPSKRHLAKLFDGYDAFVGSGLAPAILGRIGKPLNIFYPYATGVEFLGSHSDRVLLENESFVRRTVFRYIRSKQIEGIRQAQFCVNSEMSLTKQTLDEIGKPFVPLAVPMVYNRERIDENLIPDELRKLKSYVSENGLTIVSHARQMWVRDHAYSKEEWEKISKHNDWLIRGFAKFIKASTENKSVLVLLKYGPDVDATIQLCKELAIERNVLWLPKMARKQIMNVLSMCDIGVGEFCTDHGAIWGGTGWEVLASGKPLMQSFNFTQATYLQVFGHKPPPILDVKFEEDITAHLTDMALNKNKRIRLGYDSKAWFDQYNGIGLAKQWLDLLIS